MICAIVLAGGRGARMGAALPKQFLQVEGQSVLLKALCAFEAHPRVERIVAVCLDGWQDALWAQIHAQGLFKVTDVVTGGATRSESVAQAFSAGFQEEDIVLIHDAARPFVSARIIDDNIDAALQYGACGTAIPASDTISVARDGQLVATLDRETLVCMQTPQTFRFGLIRDLYPNAGATDDCTLALNAGIPVRLVWGEPGNIKLTTPQDAIYLDAVPDGQDA